MKKPFSTAQKIGASQDEIDELLKTVANVMKESARLSDIVSRLGGDEFVLLLPEVDAHQAYAVVERLRERLLDEMQKHAWPVTFSIGVVTFEMAPDSVLEMLRHADETMYQSKHNGKNRISQAIFPQVQPDGHAAHGEFADKSIVARPSLIMPQSEASEASA